MNRMAEDFTQFEAVRRLERQFAAASSRAPARSSRRRLGWVGGGLATVAVALSLTPAGAAIRDAVGFGGSEATPVSCPKQIRIARAAGMKGSFVNECPSVARTREVAEKYERLMAAAGAGPPDPGSLADHNTGWRVGTGANSRPATPAEIADAKAAQQAAAANAEVRAAAGELKSGTGSRHR